MPLTRCHAASYGGRRRNARRTANYFTWFGTFEKVETLPVSLVGAGDAIRNRPDVLAQARELGQKLVGDLAPAGAGPSAS